MKDVPTWTIADDFQPVYEQAIQQQKQYRSKFETYCTIVFNYKFYNYVCGESSLASYCNKYETYNIKQKQIFSFNYHYVAVYPISDILKWKYLSILKLEFLLKI